MAYKFQIGAAKLSGSTQFNDRVDVIGDIDLSASSIDSVEIAELNAFDTDDLSEGSNLYYTDVRARASVSAVDAGGDGSFAYNSSTGVFTYTGPSAAEARAHLSADGDLVDYNSSTGVIEIPRFSMNFWVPPVEYIFTPLESRILTNSSNPSFEKTEIKALLIVRLFSTA